MARAGDVRQVMLSACQHIPANHALAPTPLAAGGVYLWLVKQQADASQRRQIWTERAGSGDAPKRRKVARRHKTASSEVQGDDVTPAAMADSLLKECGGLLEAQRHRLSQGSPN